MEPGKLFIGGISWDTNEDRLREYFRTFGEVVEAVIMKDRSTGRARGFGFVIYADPAVAERVVKQKHMIDGRTVEAKKAVPRDDQQIPNRTINSIHGSPGPARTKKIFVGGLASTVTESDFKRYFEQFGTITDVVVMYDHNTQRPRGFGFITYDSEDAVERALVRTFHELNGKMVEVKRAVPKESFPVPSRSQLNGINNGVSRASSFFNTYTHGYNPSLLGSFGVRMDERQSPASLVRSGFSPFSSPSYGTPLSSEPRMSPGHGDTANLFSKLSQMQGMNALLNENNNRRGSFADHEGTKGVTGSYDGTTYWSLWGNGSFIDTIYSANSGSSMGSKSEGIGAAAFGSSEAIWSSSPILGQAGAAGSLSSGQNTSYSQGDTSLGLGMGLFSRNRTTSTPAASSFTLPDGGYDAIFRDFYGGNNNSHWLSSSSEINASGSFEHGLGNAVSDVPLKNPAGLCW